MPFVKRNDQGGIAAVSQTESTGFSEEVSPQNKQLMTFMADLNVAESTLGSTDQDFIRVLEDVVELLINKNIILFTDLPASAQKKMMQRQRMRSEISEKLNLIGED